MPVKSLATLVKYDGCRHYFDTIRGRSFAASFAQQIQMHNIYSAAGLRLDSINDGSRFHASIS